MPLLASLLAGLFAALVEFFARYFTKKVALATAAVAAFGALTLALWAAVTVALAGVAYSFPGGSAVAVGVWLMVPDNGPACISAIISIDTAVGLYRWNMENLRFASYVS